MRNRRRGYLLAVPGAGGRQTVLYRTWRNMKSRVNGNSTKSPWVYHGLPFAFPVFECFRCFARVMGFSKTRRSPDRIVPELGYIPGNLRFVTPDANSGTSRGAGYYGDVPF